MTDRTAENFKLPSGLNELKDVSHWVTWQRRERPDKPGTYTKVPASPKTGRGAKANDPETWGTYAQARKRWAAAGSLVDGVGFEIGTKEQHSGLIGIDLDHVRNKETGEVNLIALQIIDYLHSYTEISVSGDGFHILVKAPEIGQRADVNHKKFKDVCGAGTAVEIMYSNYYLTVSGNEYGASPIIERTNELTILQNRLVSWDMKQKNQIERIISFDEDIEISSPVSRQNQSAIPEFGFESLDEKLHRMFNSQNGFKIRALWNGDMSAYSEDHSAADLALCNHLAYWLNRDPVAMDTAFRQSGLMRDKWDREISRGKGTYGQYTIQNAIKATTTSLADQMFTAEFFRPEPPAADTAKILTPEEKREQLKETLTEKTLSRISNYISLGRLAGELSEFQSYPKIKTGYENLDEIIGSVYAGLYVIGAVSSLGKTTFCHQMAEQMAAAGQYVLYFSLEQSRLELVTKGLSRYIAKDSIMRNSDLSSATSAIGIRNGSVKVDESTISAYGEMAKCEYVIEGDFKTDIQGICVQVRDFVEAMEVKPVVFIDYLQVLRNSDPALSKGGNTRELVKSTVSMLKDLSRDLKIPVIVISSINRAAYLQPLDFESFKESGEIEYTADVIWGLQLACMNDELFNKSDSKIKEKRDFIKEEKAKNPREIEFVCLKNRYGKTNYSTYFKYYPQHDLFLDSEEPQPEIIPFDADIEVKEPPRRKKKITEL